MRMWSTPLMRAEGFCVITNDPAAAMANTVDVSHLFLSNVIQGYYFDTLWEPIRACISSTRLLGLKKNITLEKSASPEIVHIQEIRGKKLARPLELRISYEAHHVFVENEELNLWGEGGSFKEARKSFEDFFFHDLRVYKRTPAKKMDYSAREKLRAYKKLLKIR